MRYKQKLSNKQHAAKQQQRQSNVLVGNAGKQQQSNVLGQFNHNTRPFAKPEADQDRKPSKQPKQIRLTSKTDNESRKSQSKLS
jgi:hypothetical protein